MELANNLGRADPQAAIALFQGEEPGTVKDGFPAQVVPEFIIGWANEDPAAAATYLSEAPDLMTSQQQLVPIITRQWATYDLDAAGQWLNSMPPSRELDRAVSIYAITAAQESPALAMEWAESAAQSGRGNWAKRRVAQEFYRQDPEGFEQYLASSKLSEEEANRLRREAVDPDAGRRWW